MSHEFTTNPSVIAQRAKRLAQSISVAPYDHLLPDVRNDKKSPSPSISPDRLHDAPYGLSIGQSAKKVNKNLSNRAADGANVNTSIINETMKRKRQVKSRMETQPDKSLPFSQLFNMKQPQ